VIFHSGADMEKFSHKLKNFSPKRAGAEVRLKDFYLGLLISIFSLVLTFWLIPSFVSGYATGEHGLSPRFFPYLVSLAMLLLSAILMFKALRPSAEPIKKEPSRRLEPSAVICIAVFIAYQQAIAYIGFIPASFLALISLMILYGFRNWIMIVIFSAALIAILSFFFEKVAQVPLPRGLLFEWWL
jgi:putative tricarboxylic transport membrane protein